MLRTSQATKVDDVTDTLAADLKGQRTFPAVVSASCDADPLMWLRAQASEVKVAWTDRETGSCIAAAGQAATIRETAAEGMAGVIHACRQLLQDHEHLRAFGGFSFDGSDQWQGFGRARFVIPRCYLQDGRLHVVVLSDTDRHDAIEALQALRPASSDPPRPLPPPREVSHAPTRDGWQSNVDQALALIRSEVLEKVVLARKASLSFDTVLDPTDLAAELATATHDCYVFCFQFGKGNSFVGATPERLFKRNGLQFWSEVVAGTRRRGSTPGEDQRLAYELLTSEKDQLEHDIVRKSIRQRLHKLVEHLEVDTHASVLRLANKQHLCSEVVGTLKPQVDEGDLLRCLHPTPAVGGYPTENAIPEIARLEPFNRGWYAAPVGWIGAGEAEFVVGIRSGHVQENRLSLYSGAGIVKGSDPDQEWQEIENKIQDFIDLFGR